MNSCLCNTAGTRKAGMHKKKERLEDNESKKDFLHHTSNTKTRSKVVKSEFAIKPGRQDGKLIIFGKKCAYGECEKCGVEKFFIAYRCPLEWDETFELKIKEYQDLEKNNSEKKQKEIVLVNVTAMKVMEKFSKTAAAVMKHLLWSLVT